MNETSVRRLFPIRVDSCAFVVELHRSDSGLIAHHACPVFVRKVRFFQNIFTLCERFCDFPRIPLRSDNHKPIERTKTMKTTMPISNSINRRRSHRISFLALCVATAFSVAITARAQILPGHQTFQAWPISLGTSGGNINSFNGTYCCSGTLGALLQDAAGTRYILGSVILARAGFAQIGDPITQPGTRDYLCGNQPFGVVGTLTTWVPLYFYTKKNNVINNEVSAAIAQVVAPNAVSADGSILGIGPVHPSITAPSLGLKVKKSGRNTGLTRGSIKAINVAVDSDAGPVACTGSGPYNNRMVNQLKIGPDGFAVMTADSGSLVVTDEDPLPHPVGIVWAHSPSVTLACRIDTALVQLSQQLGSTLSFLPIPSSSAALAATDSAQATMAANSSVDQIKLDRALRAQERHFDALFNVPDVVGHGIGLSEGGEPVIEVYLRNENGRSRARIPAALDHVPVRVLVTGPFTAN